MLLRIDKIAVRRIRQLGCAGSAVLLVGAVLAGVAPRRDVLSLSPIVTTLRSLTMFAVACVFAGIALQLLAWWRLGTLVHRRDSIEVRELAITMAWWVAPLLVATPVFSRDVYSYLAQGAMTNFGIDAYQFGPAAMGGPLAADVPEIWQHTPAPYGPTFLSVAADVTGLTGESARWGIIGMRLLALAGVALLLWSVPRLAQASGVNPAAATWLGVLNPLVLLHLVADAHNDALMLGLMCAGLALALEHRHAAGALAITLGALVKAPAALALVFLVPIWAGHLSGRSRWPRAAAGTGWVAAATAVVATALAGTGYGWVGALDTPTRAHTWTSVTTDLGVWTGYLTQALGLASPEAALAFWRLVGLAAAGALCLHLLRRHERYGPVVGLGLGLGAVVTLGPVMHPWYLLWAVIPVAASSTSPRLRQAVRYTCVAFTLLVIPGGVQPGLATFAGVALGTLAVLATDPVTGRPYVTRLARSVLRIGRELARHGQVQQRQPVAVDAQPADHARRDRGDDTSVPERLARVDV